MTSWNFSGIDFDDMADLPSWAFEHLPLNENSEFILETPKEEEEPSVSDNMYDADDEDSDEDDAGINLDLNQLTRRIRQIKEQEGPTQVWDALQSWNFAEAVAQLSLRIGQLEDEQQEEEREKRQRQEYSQARDNETTNSLSECSDYSQEHPGIFTRRRNRQYELFSPPIHPDILNIFDYEQVEGFEIMDMELVPNALENFESMDIYELKLDYQIAPLLHPAQSFPCDTQQPEIFSIEPHWFHDTSKEKCWCHHCIQYRDFQSTGKQLETHDFNQWCLCNSCMQFWHENLDENLWCNCQNCIDPNEAEALTEENEALALLQNSLQSPSPEQEPQDQQSPSDPLCSDSTFNTVVDESKDVCSTSAELFNTVRENLWVDSDSSFDFDEE